MVKCLKKATIAKFHHVDCWLEPHCVLVPHTFSMVKKKLFDRFVYKMLLWTLFSKINNGNSQWTILFCFKLDGCLSPFTLQIFVFVNLAWELSVGRKVENGFGMFLGSLTNIGNRWTSDNQSIATLMDEFLNDWWSWICYFRKNWTDSLEEHFGKQRMHGGQV